MFILIKIYFWETNILGMYIWFVRMFYDHLSAHSLLTKLGWWGWFMRLAWKKNQKTLDASKRLHQNKTRSTGSAGKGTWSQFCHYWDCGLGKMQVHHTWRHLVGLWNVPAKWRLQLGLKCPPPRPKEVCMSLYCFKHSQVPPCWIIIKMEKS